MEWPEICAFVAASTGVRRQLSVNEGFGLLAPVEGRSQIASGRKRMRACRDLLVWMLFVAGSASLLGLGGCSGGSKAATTVTTAAGVYVVPVTVTAGASVSTVSLSNTVQ